MDNAIRLILKHVPVKDLKKISVSTKKNVRQLKPLANEEAKKRVNSKNTTTKDLKNLARCFKIPELLVKSAGPIVLKKMIKAKY